MTSSVRSALGMWAIRLTRFSAAFVFAGTIAWATFASQAQADLVGLWKFDGDVNDSSGLGNNGSLVGGAAFSADTPAALGGGQSLDISVGGSAMIPDAPSLNLPSTFTIAAWVKIQNPGFFQWIAVKGPSPPSAAGFNSGNFEFRLFVNDPKIDLLYEFNPTAQNQIFSAQSDGSVAVGEWVHVAVTAEAGAVNDTFKFYINGNLDSTKTTGNSDPFLVNNLPILIGTRNDGQVSDLLLDELAIWNTVLSDDQVAALARGPVIPEPSSFALALIVAAMGLSVYRRRVARKC